MTFRYRLFIIDDRYVSPGTENENNNSKVLFKIRLWTPSLSMPINFGIELVHIYFGFSSGGTFGGFPSLAKEIPTRLLSWLAFPAVYAHLSGVGIALPFPGLSSKY